MNPDDIFRIVIVLWVPLWVPAAVFYRVRSQRSGETLNRRAEGLPILLTLRPLGGLCVLSLVTFVIKPAWMTWASIPLPTWSRWHGVGIGVMAAALFLWTLHTLGNNLTDTVVTRKYHQLVTSGPYRWVRHPFYDGVLLCVVTASLLAANWFVFLTGCTVFALQVLRTRREEERLHARFGDAYLAYARDTGRFVPRIRRAVK